MGEKMLKLLAVVFSLSLITFFSALVDGLPPFIAPNDERIAIFTLLYPGGTPIDNQDFKVTHDRVVMRAGPGYSMDGAKFGTSWVSFSIANSTLQQDVTVTTTFEMKKKLSLWFVEENTIWSLQRPLPNTESMEFQRTSLSGSLSEQTELPVVNFDAEIYAVGAGKLFIVDEVDRNSLHMIGLNSRVVEQSIHLNSFTSHYYQVRSISVISNQYLVVVLSLQNDIAVAVFLVDGDKLLFKGERVIAESEYPLFITVLPDQDSLYIVSSFSLQLHALTEVTFTNNRIVATNLTHFTQPIESFVLPFVLHRSDDDLLILNSKSLIVFDLINKQTSRSALSCGQTYSVLISRSEYLCVVDNVVTYVSAESSAYNFKRGGRYDSFIWQGLVQGAPYLFNNRDVVHFRTNSYDQFDSAHYARLPPYVPGVADTIAVDLTTNILHWTAAGQVYEFNTSSSEIVRRSICSNYPQGPTGFFYNNPGDLNIVYFLGSKVLVPQPDGTCKAVPLGCSFLKENSKYISTAEGMVFITNDQVCRFTPTGSEGNSTSIITIPGVEMKYLFSYDDQEVIWFRDKHKDIYLVRIPSNLLFTNIELRYKKYGRKIYSSSEDVSVCGYSNVSPDYYAMILVCGSKYERLIVEFGAKRYLRVYPTPFVVDNVNYKITSVGNRTFVVGNPASGEFDIFKAYIAPSLQDYSWLGVVIVSIIGVLAFFVLLSVCIAVYLYLKLRRHWAEMQFQQRELTEMLLDYDNENSEFRHGRIRRNTHMYNMIPFDQLRIDRCISEGAGGIVFAGFWKATRTKVAIKKMRLENDVPTVAKEVSILANLRHPNIVLFCGISVDSKKIFYIVSELVEKGSLDALLYNANNKKRLSFDDKVKILSGISKGMAYLHSKNPQVIHRDLKPQNILIDSDFTPKICDFGLSKFIVSNDMTANTMGTQGYISPEILEASANYTEKVDVYSFGILMHELFFVAKPYRSIAQNRAPLISTFESAYSFGKKVIAGLRPEIPFGLDDIAQMEEWYQPCHKPSTFDYMNVRTYFELMTSCWDADPEKRPSFSTICDALDNWIQSE